LGKRAILLD